MKNTYLALVKNNLLILGFLALIGFLLPTNNVKAQLEESRFPYTKTMVISAYYSPLPDQARYATGSYAGDIRLNGSGVNGADGTPVYPGMIAAPPEYPFGFKMNIPGIGTVSVHDRGGAIKGNRLDVWMGYGDEGLKRALNWGKRTVDVKMYGLDDSVKESVYLETYYEAETVVREIVKPNRLFPTDLSLGSTGEKVELLQETLQQLGFYEFEVTGDYDQNTQNSVFEFQKANSIVESWDELGAGYCGVQTRAALEHYINSGSLPKTEKVEVPNPTEVFFSSSLKRGDTGEDVVNLQKELYKLGFLRVPPTGIFDELTEHAVFKFQQKKGILKNKSDLGAGVVGPQTKSALNIVFSDRARFVASVKSSKSNQTIVQLEDQRSEVVAFNEDMDFGDNSSQVSKLQKTLKTLGYFGGNVTTFFGERTFNALVAFQVDKGIVNSEESFGAGRVGPQTRSVLNRLLSNI
jgi:peptidoglycan hydrolase-like protein with peptidoglycan-binding domain/3D (Asp-Asp-Asp) domain-containing protein